MCLLQRQSKGFLFYLVALVYFCSGFLSAQAASKAQINPLLEVGSLDYKMAYEALQKELSMTLPLIAERLNLSEQHLIEALDKLTTSESALNEAKKNAKDSANLLQGYRDQLQKLKDEYQKALEASKQQALEYKSLQAQYANLLILLAASEASQKQLIEQSEGLSQALSLSETEREKAESRAKNAEAALPWLIGGGIALIATAFLIGHFAK